VTLFIMLKPDETGIATDTAHENMKLMAKYLHEMYDAIANDGIPGRRRLEIKGTSSEQQGDINIGTLHLAEQLLEELKQNVPSCDISKLETKIETQVLEGRNSEKSLFVITKNQEGLLDAVLQFFRLDDDGKKQPVPFQTTKVDEGQVIVTFNDRRPSESEAVDNEDGEVASFLIMTATPLSDDNTAKETTTTISFV
jgi:hypothetical protein